MNCNECHSPMTQLGPREITDPQPSRFIPRWRCDEKECPRQGEVVEDYGKEEKFEILDYLTDSPQSVTAIAKQAHLAFRETAVMLVTASLNGTAVEVYSGAYARAKTAVEEAS